MCHHHDVFIPNNFAWDRIYCFFFLFFKLLLCEQVYTHQLILGWCCQPFLQIDYLRKFWVCLLLMSVEILCAVFGVSWFQWEHNNWMSSLVDPEYYLRQLSRRRGIFRNLNPVLCWYLVSTHACFYSMEFWVGDCSY